MSNKQNRRVTIRLTPFQAKTLWQLRTEDRDRGDERTSTEVLLAGLTRLGATRGGVPAVPTPYSNKNVGQRTEAIEKRVCELEAKLPELKALIEQLEVENTQLKEKLAESERQRGLLSKELSVAVAAKPASPFEASGGFVGAVEVEFDVETDGRVIAEAPAVPGAMAYGETREEAQAKVEEIVAEVRG